MIRHRVETWLWAWSAESRTSWDGQPGRGLVGQADDGEWFVEQRGRWIRLRLHRPRHLAALLRSRRRAEAVMLERGA